MAILDDLKTMLDIPSDENGQDSRLSIILENAKRQVLSYLPHESDVPDALSYIVLELSIIRYNRLGNEGMKTYEQEGERMEYTDDIKPYVSAIEAWKNSSAVSNDGTVRFL